MDDVAERNPVKYDRKLNDGMAQVSKRAELEAGKDGRSIIANQIEEIFRKATDGGGAIDGKAYQNLRTSLGKLSAQTQVPGLADLAGELREVLDDALQRSTRKQDLMDLRAARTDYRRLKQIEGSIDELGQISPSKLANSMSGKSNRRAAIYGRGDQELVRLARAAKAILPDKFPNSGTTARFMAQLSKMNTAGAAMALTLAPFRVGASLLMNRQPKRKPAAVPAESTETQVTNRLSALGGD